MSKPTIIKETGQKDKHRNKPLAGTVEVKFQFYWSPVEKMDNSLTGLTKTNSSDIIEKISEISVLKNLNIWSLGRNYIKSLSGLEGYT